MRFSARSPSPSPSRCKTESFLWPQSSDSGSSSESDESQTSSSSESDKYGSDDSGSSSLSVSPAKNRNRQTASASSLSASGRVQIDETVAAIRLRARHHDPYEEWAKRTRSDALHTARRAVVAAQTERESKQAVARAQDAERQAAALKREADEVARRLAQISMRQADDEKRLGNHWSDQQKMRRAHTEHIIQSEEEKVRARLAEERLAQVEAERLRKEAEAKAAAEEQRKREEAARAAKEAEEAKARADQEEAARKEAEKVELAKAQALEAQAQERDALGMTTPDQDWREARLALKQLKSGPIARVKADRESKKIWNDIRRKITPRVGQLTNEPAVIASISQQIVQTLRPQTALPPDVYFASLSSLAKAILLQAETEVTAEKRSAKPIAQLTLNSISALDGFSVVFWAKLCQRTGGWAVPVLVPSKDVDGTPFTPVTHRKASGLREEETSVDHTTRVAGIMRVYFSLLLLPPSRPLPREFHLSRFWTFVARLVGQPALLRSALATQLLSVALEVGGAHARDVWGSQWIKLMVLLYEGLTTDPPPLGGSGPDAHASRVRLQLEIERVMGKL
ncbi:GLE1-like protein-domain-containing protein [Lactarius psammicola]|nr:GLE1-like protein-domain-containing protein [Lactarius psammicola]